MINLCAAERYKIQVDQQLTNGIRHLASSCWALDQGGNRVGALPSWGLGKTLNAIHWVLNYILVRLTMNNIDKVGKNVEFHLICKVRQSEIAYIIFILLLIKLIIWLNSEIFIKKIDYIPLFIKIFYICSL